jgi:hypothetical protein
MHPFSIANDIIAEPKELSKNYELDIMLESSFFFQNITLKEYSSFRNIIKIGTFRQVEYSSIRMLYTFAPFLFSSFKFSKRSKIVL